MITLSPNRIASCIAERAVIHSAIERKKKDYLRYGLEWALIGGYQVGITLLISTFLGIFLESLVSLLTIAILRVFAGGAHFQNVYKCLLASITLNIFIASTSLLVHNYLGDIRVVILISAPIFVLLTWKFCPSLYSKMNTFSAVYVRKLKIISTLIVSIILIIAFLAPAIYTIVILLSLAYQTLTVTTIGAYLISKMDSLGKGGLKNVN